MSASQAERVRADEVIVVNNDDPREQARKQRSLLQRRWRQTWKITLGSFLILLGLILIPLPGPGTLIVIAGLAVMADEVPVADRMLKWMRRRFDQATSKVRNRKR